MPSYKIVDGEKVLHHQTLSPEGALEAANQQQSTSVSPRSGQDVAETREALLKNLTAYFAKADDSTKPKISDIKLIKEFSNINKSILDDAWKQAQAIKKQETK